MSNQVKESYIGKELVSIPFYELLLNYSGSFRQELDAFSVISNKAKDKLLISLINELSLISELTFQKELEDYLVNFDCSYLGFVQFMSFNLSQRYPFLDEILKGKCEKYKEHIEKIIYRFSCDRENISNEFDFLCDSKNLIIDDFDISVGDTHNGQSTAILNLSNGNKIVYKPVNISITKSFNYFIDWVNDKLNIKIDTFRTVDCEEYGWLEFIKQEEIIEDNGCKNYYFNAGSLLAITYLLGSKDCHHENVISSSNSPVLIDHETIIQPTLINAHLYPSYEDTVENTILESFLIFKENDFYSLGMAGFGNKFSIYENIYEKKVVYPNSLKSKRVTKFSTKNFVIDNIPRYKGENQFIRDHKKDFKEGFNRTYDLFLDYKNDFLSKDLFLNNFKSQQVRYVWRPTFVYASILQYLRKPEYMSCEKKYKNRLYSLLYKAYSKKEMTDYKFILEIEFDQMLNYDIPIFTANTGEYSFTNIVKEKVFRESAIDNIKRRVNSLSHQDKEIQNELINVCIH